MDSIVLPLSCKSDPQRGPVNTKVKFTSLTGSKLLWHPLFSANAGGFPVACQAWHRLSPVPPCPVSGNSLLHSRCFSLAGHQPWAAPASGALQGCSPERSPPGPSQLPTSPFLRELLLDSSLPFPSSPLSVYFITQTCVFYLFFLSLACLPNPKLNSRTEGASVSSGSLLALHWE